MKITHPLLRLMRLHQPVGIWLLLWPCWWALALSGAQAWMYAAFALGAVAMRGAGCIVNDLWDRKLDAQVERTRSRPLASGEVSVAQALALLAALLALGLLAALSLGPRVVAWGALSLPLVAAYPLMKRLTWWPQAFLGVTFNWGALLGAVAVRGEPTLAALFLYIGGIFWTLGYDTIYAHQDKLDDARAGVKSTARRLGARTKPWLSAFYGAALLAFAAAGWAAAVSLPYYIVLAAVGAHFTWQVRRVALDVPAFCHAVFASNAWAGAAIFMACVLGAAPG